MEDLAHNYSIRKWWSSVNFKELCSGRNSTSGSSLFTNIILYFLLFLYLNYRGSFQSNLDQSVSKIAVMLSAINNFPEVHLFISEHPDLKLVNHSNKPDILYFIAEIENGGIASLELPNISITSGNITFQGQPIIQKMFPVSHKPPAVE